MSDLSSMYNDEIHTFSWGDDQMQAPAATEVDAPDTGSHFCIHTTSFENKKLKFCFSYLNKCFKET